MEDQLSVFLALMTEALFIFSTKLLMKSCDDFAGLFMNSRAVLKSRAISLADLNLPEKNRIKKLRSEYLSPFVFKNIKVYPFPSNASNSFSVLSNTLSSSFIAITTPAFNDNFLRAVASSLSFCSLLPSDVIASSIASPWDLACLFNSSFRAPMSDLPSLYI